MRQTIDQRKRVPRVVKGIVSLGAIALGSVIFMRFASALFGAAPTLIDAKPSRDFEREADAFARDWLVGNGIAPGRISAILCRMQGESGGDGETGPARHLESHPATDERTRCDSARSLTDRYFDDSEKHHEADVRADALRELKEDAARDAREDLERAREELSSSNARDEP